MKHGFLLIPGAGLSDWIWQFVVPKLQAEVICVDRRLFVNNEHMRRTAVFSDCIHYLNHLIEKSGFDQVTVVSHSAAGLLGAGLGKCNSKVNRLVFISANIPANGKTAIDALDPDMKAMMLSNAVSQLPLDSLPMLQMEKMFREKFCNTCTEVTIQTLLKQEYMTEPLCLVTEQMNWDDYPEISKTYIVLTKDLIVPAAGQIYMAKRFGIEDLNYLSSDHLPMLSHPEQLAQLLLSRR